MKKPPAPVATLAPELLRQLDGSQLETMSSEAIRLTTMDADGWPRAAQLSVGEILAVNASELRIAVWPNSQSTANLRRDGRLTLSLVCAGALWEIRGVATLLAEHQTALDLVVFRVAIEGIAEQRSPYAEIVSGLTFRLTEREKTLARWQEQIDAMRKLPYLNATR